MSDGRPELVSVRTRRAVREMMSDTVLRDIDGMAGRGVRTRY